VQSRKRSLTVAGQWRIFTALPEHPTSELLYVCSTTVEHLPQWVTWCCLEKLASNRNSARLKARRYAAEKREHYSYGRT
jgi:hypothetical protein